jgi:hypothetical protein
MIQEPNPSALVCDNIREHVEQAKTSVLRLVFLQSDEYSLLSGLAGRDLGNKLESSMV